MTNIDKVTLKLYKDIAREFILPEIGFIVIRQFYFLLPEMKNSNKFYLLNQYGLNYRKYLEEVYTLKYLSASCDTDGNTYEVYYIENIDEVLGLLRLKGI